MTKASTATAMNEPADRVIDATVTLLADKGPSALKVREVAAASGLSTMAVYHHFGGMAELIQAVVEHGFEQLDATFTAITETDDPVQNQLLLALATRDLARANPHLYDLMFGLSTRSTYRTIEESEERLSGRSPVFRKAFQNVVHQCARTVDSGRVRPIDPVVMASQLWVLVHGFITLELAGHFSMFDDPASEVLLPLGVSYYVGLGDQPERAAASHVIRSV